MRRFSPERLLKSGLRRKIQTSLSLWVTSTIETRDKAATYVNEMIVFSEISEEWAKYDDLPFVSS